MKDWKIITLLGFISFTNAVNVSILSSVYPREADKREFRMSDYSLVFGIYAWVAFIVCPIYGKYMGKVGAKYFLTGGLITTGLAIALFGCLEVIKTHSYFLGFSLLFRIIGALGNSACFIASFSIAALLLKERVGTTYAILESSYVLGLIIGPTIGEYLFQVQGFYFPLLLVGVVLLVEAAAIVWFLPSVEDKDLDTKKPGEIISVLKMAPLLLDFFNVISAHVATGFNVATLLPRLIQFGVSFRSIAATYVISSICYVLSSPVLGRICDTKINPKKLILCGNLLVIASFSFLGPLPFIPVHTSLWMILLGLVILGLALSFILVPAYIDAIRSAIRYGMADNINTYSVVMGVSTSSVFLGAILGSAIAGVLVEMEEYRYVTLFVIAFHLTLFLAMTCFLYVEKQHTQTSGGSEGTEMPLLSKPRGQ